MKKKWLRPFLAFLGMCVFGWSSASPTLADIFMKQQQHIDGFTIMGQTQPPRDSIQTIWMSEDKLRSDDDEHSVLVRLDKRTIYLIDHARKAYEIVPMDTGKMAAEAIDDEEDMAPGGRKIQVTVTETGEKKKINDWNCRKYIQKVVTVMGPMTSEVWATEDIKIDDSLYARFSAAMLAMQPGLSENLGALTEEMKKIRGVPVLTTTTTRVMNSTMKSSQKLLEFKEGKAPAGTFDLPGGYTRQSLGEGGVTRRKRP
ncbi:MAG: DUF4412 domain-containing protein [Syntrophobacteraceae bacterium]|nr:DUF4412 domain-containing protein [Syntrophobacteraceae bacterium]